jgi:RimJ/RimL family protein N-acetyltransferase
MSMSHRIIVRHASIADIKSISSVLAASWRYSYRGIVSNIYLDMLRDDHWISSLTSGMEGGRLFAMVLIKNEQLIGAAVMNKTNEPAIIELTSIYLLPDQIGRGYGTLFYQAIETEIKGLGYRTCVLDVLENNSIAIRFYAKHGFVDDGDIIKVTLGGQDYICKVMKKSF